MNLYRNTSNEVETAHAVTPTVPSAMMRRLGRLSSDQADAMDFVTSNDVTEAKIRRIHDPMVHKASSRLTITDSLKVMAGIRTWRKERRRRATNAQQPRHVTSFGSFGDGEEGIRLSVHVVDNMIEMRLRLKGRCAEN